MALDWLENDTCCRLCVPDGRFNGCRVGLALEFSHDVRVHLSIMSSPLKARLTHLYTGTTPVARRFRYGLIAFDFVTIIAFICMAPLAESPSLEYVAFVLGLLILLDFSARLWIAPNRIEMLRRIYVIADIIVIFALLIAPFITANLAFLRILRGLRLIHSYHLMNDLRQNSLFFRKHEDAFIAAINLFVFIFFTTSLVFAVFVTEDQGLAAYVDALYFTVTTLTTTGYGDITPTTVGGKLLSVMIMVIGVALFVQLARAIFSPAKVKQTCERCGLSRHDPDAVHCKHCGAVMNIKTTGLT